MEKAGVNGTSSSGTASSSTSSSSSSSSLSSASSSLSSSSSSLAEASAGLDAAFADYEQAKADAERTALIILISIIGGGVCVVALCTTLACYLCKCCCWKPKNEDQVIVIGEGVDTTVGQVMNDEEQDSSQGGRRDSSAAEEGSESDRGYESSNRSPTNAKTK